MGIYSRWLDTNCDGYVGAAPAWHNTTWYPGVVEVHVMQREQKIEKRDKDKDNARDRDRDNFLKNAVSAKIKVLQTQQKLARDKRATADEKKRTGANVAPRSATRDKGKRDKRKGTKARNAVGKAAADAAKAKQNRVDEEELERAKALYDSINFEDVDDDDDDIDSEDL